MSAFEIYTNSLFLGLCGYDSVLDEHQISLNAKRRASYFGGYSDVVLVSDTV